MQLFHYRFASGIYLSSLLLQEERFYSGKN